MFYDFTNKLPFGLEAQNLTDSAFRQLMQQSIGDKEPAWFQSERRSTASLRYSF